MAQIIKADIDTKELESTLGLTAKNLAFATVNAVNDTAKQIQKLAQDNVRSKFTLRGGQQSDFLLRNAAIIKPFASVNQGRAYAEIAVGIQSRLLLSIFEAGGARRPFIGANVAIPIIGNPARPSFASRVPESLQIRALRMRPEASAATRLQSRTIKESTRKGTNAARKQFLRGQAKIWQGANRTYLIPNVGIFQRFGPKRLDTKLLYLFRPQETLPQKLGFLSLAMQQGASLFGENMQRALIKELSLKRKG